MENIELPCVCNTDSYYVVHHPNATRQELGPVYEDVSAISAPYLNQASAATARPSSFPDIQPLARQAAWPFLPARADAVLAVVAVPMTLHSTNPGR
jgi:hypothetical protein